MKTCFEMMFVGKMSQCHRDRSSVYTTISVGETQCDRLKGKKKIVGIFHVDQSKTNIR